MASRAVWLVVAVAVAGGCSYRLPYRECGPDAAATCCPAGSHWVEAGDEVFLCVPDDAGADACEDADADGH